MLILSALGLMFILEYAYILNIPRRFLCKYEFFRELFSCGMCLGFWSGIIVATVAKFATTGLTFGDIPSIVLFGLAISFLGMTADLLIEIGDEVKCYLFNKNKNKKS